MRIVVTGATGNVGSAVVRALEPTGHEIVEVSRRPRGTGPGHIAADLTTADLDLVVRGADAVVHLAWQIQPSRDPDQTRAVNVVATRRLLEAVVRQEVPAFVAASSIAAYSPRHDGEPVDESWPTDSPSSAAYAREKAYDERLFDLFEQRAPAMRVVRLRPAFIFQRAAAAAQRRLFAGPFLPTSLLRPGRLPALPVPRGLRLQAVHADDVAAAVAAAVKRPVSGAFNLAGDGLLRRDELAALLGTRGVDVPPRLTRAALQTAWQAHLVPAPGALFDALMRLPVMSSARAAHELDWHPRHTAAEALAELLAGLREGSGGDTPVLATSPRFAGSTTTKGAPDGG